MEGGLCYLRLSTELSKETLETIEQATEAFGISSGISTLLRNSLKARTSGLDPGFPVELLSKQNLYVYDIVDGKKWKSGEELASIVEPLAKHVEVNIASCETEIKRIKATLPAHQRKILSDTFLYLVYPFYKKDIHMDIFRRS